MVSQTEKRCLHRLKNMRLQSVITSLLKIDILPRTCSDISENMSRKHRHEKRNNRDCLRKILFCIWFGGTDDPYMIHIYTFYVR